MDVKENIVIGTIALTVSDLDNRHPDINVTI